ncbi:MAG: hypothetical protein Rubg2KO_31480 [Rubricoccaceae bacterium]
MRPFVFLFLALAMSAASSMAQTSWRSMPDGPSVSLDVLGSIGDDLQDSGPSLPSGEIIEYTIGITAASMRLAGQVPLGQRWTLRGELPFAYIQYSSQGPPFYVDTYNGSDLAMGSPYLGAEVELVPTLTLEAGLRWPAPRLGLTSYEPRTYAPGADRSSASWRPDASIAGQMTDPERYGAYWGADCGGVTSAVRFEPSITPSVGARVRLAPALVCGYHVLVGYSAQAVVDLDHVGLSVGVVGQRFVSDTVRGPEYDVLPSLTANVGRTIGPVRPGFTAHLPLSKNYLSADAVVGFSLDVPLR